MGCDILTSESCQNQLSIFSELKKFKEYLSNFDYESVIDDLVNQKTFLYGDPVPSDNFKTLRGIQDYVQNLKNRIDECINNISGDSNSIDWNSIIDQLQQPSENYNIIKDSTSIIDALAKINNYLNTLTNNQTQLNQTLNTKQDIITAVVNPNITDDGGNPTVNSTFNNGELSFAFKNLKLRFSDLTAADKEAIRGPQGTSAVFDPETGNILASLENTTGQSTSNAMTQKAVTDELKNITDVAVKVKTTSDIVYNAGRVNGSNWNKMNSSEDNPSDGFYMNVVAYRGMRVKITPQSGKRVRVGFTQNILIRSGATTTDDFALVDGTSVSNGTAIVYADGYSNVIYPAANVAIDVMIPGNCNYLWCSYLYGSSGDIRPLSIEFFESKTINILNTELREAISTSAEETSANVLAAAENSIGLVNFHPTTDKLGAYTSGNGYYLAKENGVWVWKADTSNYTGRTIAWSDPTTKGMSILVVPQENQLAYIAFVKSSPKHDDGVVAGDEVEFCEGWERVKVDKPTVFTVPTDEGNLRFFYMVKYNGNNCGPQYYQRGYTISESLDKHNERISNLETLSVDGKEAAFSTRTGAYILKEAYTQSNCGNTTKSTIGYLWLIPNKGYTSLECKNLYSWVSSYGAQITLYSEMEISHQYFIKDISQGDKGFHDFSMDLTPYKDTCKLIVVASTTGNVGSAEITLKVPMLSVIENLSKNSEESSDDDTTQNTVKDMLGQARYGYTYTYTSQSDTDYTIPIKAVTFLHFSDLHGDEQSMQAIKSFLDANSSLIDDAVNTGDTLTTAWYTSSEDEPADNSWGVYEEVGLDCAIHAVGNHDRRSDYGVKAGSTASYRKVPKQQAYERYFANASTWGLTVPSDVNAPYLMFGYKDYPFTDIINILGDEAANFTGTLGVRLIVLDGESILNDGATSVNTAYNNAQISLFRTALKDARDNKLMVVVASHYTPGTYVSEGIVKKADGEKVSFHAYGNSSATGISSTFRLPSAYGQAVQDFIDGVSMMGEEVDSENPVHGKFAIWLCGHYHQDKLAYASKSFEDDPSENTSISDVLFSAINKSGYNSKDTTAGRAKDKYRYCANIVTIQPYYSTIKIQRIGINMDNRLRPINVLSYIFSWDAEKRKVIANY